MNIREKAIQRVNDYASLFSEEMVNTDLPKLCALKEVNEMIRDYNESLKMCNDNQLNLQVSGLIAGSLFGLYKLKTEIELL